MTPPRPIAASSTVFVPFPPEAVDQTLHARFEQQVARHPDRPAIKAEGRTLTYAALNREANRLARAILAQAGAGDEPVALLLDRASTGLTAMLAVLKAGRAYFPVDPTHPRARTAGMLEDAGTRVIVTDGAHLALAAELTGGAAVIDVDTLSPLLSGEDIGHYPHPDALAFILYTSGSTGRPKGVMQTHRNLLYGLMHTTNSHRIVAADRVSLLASLNYVAAFGDVFTALSNGACVLPFDLKREDVRALATWLQQEQISVLRTVPTVFRHLGRVLRAEERFPRLHVIRLGGEIALRRDVELFQTDHFPPQCRLVNRLAATEHSIHSQYWVDKATPLPQSIVPVGFPVEGTEVLLLAGADSDVEVAPGEIGEIVVRSRYASPGYWHDPAATAATFAPDPRGGGARFYRTGDVGRRLPGGELECLGRKDFQVKVRGHRIEAGEIELALLDLEPIRGAVVVTREDRYGDQQLVAYVVAKAGSLPAPAALRDALRQRLPEHMVPALFQRLDALPLTASGSKVDRRALPPPEEAQPAPYGVVTSGGAAEAAAGAAPRTPIEDVLLGIWSAVLGLDGIGIDDDFISLGGQSLLAAQVVSRVRDTWGVELPVRSLLERPTVATLATAIVQRQLAAFEADAIAQLLGEIDGSPAAAIAPLDESDRRNGSSDEQGKSDR